MGADTAVLPRRRRRRWRPPNLREQRAIWRCCWALAAVAVSVIVNIGLAGALALVLGSLAWVAVYQLIGADFRHLRFTEPSIVLRYLRTAYTDEG